MQVKCLMLLFAVCLSQGWAFDASYTLDRSLLGILLRTPAANRNSNSFYECYNYYTGQMNEAQKRYEVKYQACVRSYELGLEAANDATAEQRQALYSLISGSSNSADVCQREKMAVAEFNCISNESAALSRKLTEIANDAILQRQELDKQHKLVLHNREVCAKLNQDNLQEQTNDILEEWDRCNAGLVTIPPREETSQAPSTWIDSN